MLISARSLDSFLEKMENRRLARCYANRTTGELLSPILIYSASWITGCRFSKHGVPLPSLVPSRENMAAYMKVRVAFIALIAAVSCAADTSTVDAHFKEIYTKEWAWRQAQRGEQDEDSAGSRRGISPKLPKVDLKTQEVRLAYWSDVIKQLDQIDRDALSSPEQTNFDVYNAQIQVLINNQKFRDYEKP
jgi:hypothetical protein